MADTPLRALVADDEEPARAELVYLLGQDPRIGQILTAENGPDALKILQATDLDVVFCDIKMPGLDGIDLASVLSKFRQPRPRIVFVTAYDEHAVAAFDLDAADYVMKPVRAERLSEAVRRVVTQGAPAALQSPDDSEDETIAVELAGVTRWVQRSTVRYVEAQGDYARLHTGQNSHLVRIPLSTLEERWRDAGFTRIHRSTLVALAHIDEMRVDSGRCAVRVGGDWLPVSRRHTRELRDLLVRSTSLR
ncbi:LytR/AlgR family response regulator transcription factor [Kribbella kalugense]|uniref:LytTR family two component transcriptional regulator n=1 Tax=Kribbella kalugense TaxID=2512221 RepID=A0A4R7ZNA2_9ACTN|nr:LytTR family DNA-binding domain-containing protein [Kribbella kalugense]TDW18796.1 LytTR family two component transcriptional regulator [Kribbella kalugense]